MTGQTWQKRLRNWLAALAAQFWQSEPAVMATLGCSWALPPHSALWR